MARTIRIEYPGAVYHLMARGNQGQSIFGNDKDRQRWLETLAEACAKTGWQVHAYVLMSNHFHLLVETPEANLVVGMKWLQGTYTQRYNRQHQVAGHLFQGRYKALVVQGEEGEYFEAVSTYIHLNPARAGLVKVGQERLRIYRWSSYPSYLERAGKRPEWLRTDRVLGSLGFGAEEAKARKGYEAYMEGRVLELGLAGCRKQLEEQWRDIRRGWYLGGEGFRERMLGLIEQQLQGHSGRSYSGGAKQTHGEQTAERRLREGLKQLGLSPEDLDRLPKGAPEKQALAWWLRQGTIVSRRWLSERLRMGDESRVTQAVREMGRTQDGQLWRWKRQLMDWREKDVGTGPT